MARRSRILVVEDEFLLATDLAYTLQTAGYDVTGPTPSVRDALEAIASSHPDAAILDIQLIDGKSFPVARRLVELGLPFIFLTGFTKTDIPDDLASRPRISKLEPHSKVLDALRLALDRAGPAIPAKKRSARK